MGGTNVVIAVGVSTGPRLLWGTEVPTLLLLPPLGSLILEPDLYSSFRQVNPGSQLGTDMDVRVMGEVEELLQLL